MEYCAALGRIALRFTITNAEVDINAPSCAVAVNVTTRSGTMDSGTDMSDDWPELPTCLNDLQRVGQRHLLNSERDGFGCLGRVC